MKKIIILILLLSTSVTFFSQNNKLQNDKFKVTKLGQTYSLDQLKKAVGAADWCGYFHKTEHYLLKFDDGAEVELLSYSELVLAGISVDGSCVQQESKSDSSVYGIHASGFVTKRVAKNSNIKSFEGK